MVGSSGIPSPTSLVFCGALPLESFGKAPLPRKGKAMTAPGRGLDQSLKSDPFVVFLFVFGGVGLFLVFFGGVDGESELILIA